MKYENYIKLEFPSKSCNEALARSVAGVFASQMDPTMEELGDIKTAVSEAVTNCIVHAYPDCILAILSRGFAQLCPVCSVIIGNPPIALLNFEFRRNTQTITAPTPDRKSVV